MRVRWLKEPAAALLLPNSRRNFSRCFTLNSTKFTKTTTRHDWFQLRQVKLKSRETLPPSENMFPGDTPQSSWQAVSNSIQGGVRTRHTQGKTGNLQERDGEAADVTWVVMRNPDHWFKSSAHKDRIEIQRGPRSLCWIAAFHERDWK